MSNPGGQLVNEDLYEYIHGMGLKMPIIYISAIGRAFINWLPSTGRYTVVFGRKCIN